jgi:small subunit ribosomal protein S1
LENWVGELFKVRVLGIDQAENKIFFSEKAAFEEQRQATISLLNPGDIVDGVVSGIYEFGLMVRFSGIEGLVHVSEIDWGHVSVPGKFAQIGDRVRVVVIGKDDGKISLSIKRLQLDPWAELSAKFKV